MKAGVALTFAIIFGASICNSIATECQTEHPLRPDYCDGVCCPAVDGGGPGGCCPFFKRIKINEHIKFNKIFTFLGFQ